VLLVLRNVTIYLDTEETYDATNTSGNITLYFIHHTGRIEAKKKMQRNYVQCTLPYKRLQQEYC